MTVISIPSTAILDIPLELWREIFKDLPRADFHGTALICQSLRSTSQSLLFEHLVYRNSFLHRKLQRIYDANRDLKAFVRTLDIKGGYRLDWGAGGGDQTILFKLLPTLPNLRSFSFSQIHPLLDNPSNDRRLLLDSLRKAPLIEISLYLDDDLESVPLGLPARGLPNLKCIALDWGSLDHPGAEGSSLQHLHEFIRPSLSSLVVFKLHYMCPQGFDLRFLLPAAKTLRTLDYTMAPLDDSVLDLVPNLFPDLTTLALQWRDGETRFSLPWKDEYILPLSKNRNLVELTLSNDFEQAADDPVRRENHVAWFLRSYTRRLEAARKVCTSLTWLQRCNWLQVCIGKDASTTMLHPFLVEERCDKQGIEKVVRGIQQRWMGRNYMEAALDEPGTTLTRAKLEFIPGEVIGKNNSGSE